MKSLVITYTVNNQLNPNLFSLFDATTKLTQTTDVLVVGHDLNEAAKLIASYQVVDNVFTLDNIALASLLPENMAIQLADRAKGYTHVLIAADSFGKNLLPRIAGILEIAQISEVVSIITPNIFKKFTYAGNVLTEVEALGELKLLTIRTINFTTNTALKDGSMAEIINLSYTNPINTQIKVIQQNAGDKVIDLNSAKVVVTGGIAVGSAEAFDQNIRALAQKINAGVGASRAAVEAGYAPNDCQVGQTGKIVAPEVYLAIGLSGAVQHIAGMKDSKTVIAINTDRSAPIFEHADYGLVGDLFTIVPEILTKI